MNGIVLVPRPRAVDWGGGALEETGDPGLSDVGRGGVGFLVIKLIFQAKVDFWTHLGLRRASTRTPPTPAPPLQYAGRAHLSTRPGSMRTVLVMSVAPGLRTTLVRAANSVR